MKEQTRIVEFIREWDKKDIANLAFLTGISSDDSTAPLSDIEDKIRWHYHSKVRHNITRRITNVAKKDKKVNEPKCPTYEDLLKAAAKKLSIEKYCETIEDYELYIPESIIARALAKAKPSDRHSLLTEEFNTGPMWDAAGIKSRKLTGVKTTAGALALANATGFGVYAAATTAVGFATHAVGITLPFAAYTGMTSTMGVILGPPGWLAVATWAFFKVTEKDWDKLMPVVLLLIATKSRYSILNQRER